jgi:hypothetical protein
VADHHSSTDSVFKGEIPFVTRREEKKIPPHFKTSPGRGPDIKETSYEDLSGRRYSMEGSGPVRRCEDQPFPSHLFRHIFSGRISKIKSRDLPASPLPSQESGSRREGFCQAKSIVDRYDRDDFHGSTGDRMDDDRGGPEDVDDDNCPV